MKTRLRPRSTLRSRIPQIRTDSGLIGDGVRVVSRLLAADRGMASAENERLAEGAGVKQVALPHVGKTAPGRQAEEKGRRFRDGYRFRAGVEGRIHALKRDYWLRRCRYHGERGFGRWVGWGIVAHNLAKVAGAARG